MPIDRLCHVLICWRTGHLDVAAWDEAEERLHHRVAEWAGVARGVVEVDHDDEIYIDHERLGDADRERLAAWLVPQLRDLVGVPPVWLAAVGA